MNRSVCTICADYLTCGNSVACPCGHTFHYECIIRWKDQSSTCPQCRERFKAPIKLYFELSREDKVEGDPAELRNEVTELNLKIRIRDTSLDTLKKQNDALTQANKSRDEEKKNTQHLLESALGTNDALKKQLTYMEKYKSDAKKAKEDLLKLQKKVGSYHNIEELVNGESHNIEKTLKNFADNPDAFNQICTSYVLLKKEFERIKESKRSLENERRTLRRKSESLAREAYESKEQLNVVTNDLEHLDERNKSLTKKISMLEKSLASSSPQSSALKRLLCESPAPSDLIKKKQCFADIPRELKGQVADESLQFSGGPNEDDGLNEDDTDKLVIVEEDCINSSITRKPLADVTGDRNNVKKKPSHHNKWETMNKNSDLARFKQGFNLDVKWPSEECGLYENHPGDHDLGEEDSLKALDEFGLEYVATTCVAAEKPLNEPSRRNFKSSFASKNVPSSHIKVSNENSDLPHFRRGFNGMGGQSKTLIIPKRPGPIVKHVNKKGFKIPKNNTKITRFISEQKPSAMNISP